MKANVEMNFKMVSVIKTHQTETFAWSLVFKNISVFETVG